MNLDNYLKSLYRPSKNQGIWVNPKDLDTWKIGALGYSTEDWVWIGSLEEWTNSKLNYFENNIKYKKALKKLNSQECLTFYDKRNLSRWTDYNTWLEENRSEFEIDWWNQVGQALLVENINNALTHLLAKA